MLKPLITQLPNWLKPAKTKLKKILITNLEELADASLVPKAFKAPQVITEANSIPHPKLDLANPRVQAALINAQARHYANYIVLFTGLFGTIGIVTTMHDKSQTRKISAQKEIIDEKDAIIKASKDELQLKEKKINEHLATIAERDQVVKDLQASLETFEKQEEEIEKCRQSRWCAFFLKQTNISVISLPEKAAPKLT